VAKGDGRGGKREGAGRPPGVMDEDTKKRRDAEKEYKRRVAGMTDQLLNAQLALALGEINLFKKTKRGNKTITTLIDDIETVKEYLSGNLKDKDNEYYYLATKPPDNKALDSVLDRTYGKSRQSVDITSGDEPLQPTLPVSNVVLDSFREYMLQTTLPEKFKPKPKPKAKPKKKAADGTKPKGT